MQPGKLRPDYAQILRPKINPRRFTATNPYWWKEVTNIGDYYARWGGEVAAEKLTGYLKPATVTIYYRVPGNTKDFTRLVTDIVCDLTRRVRLKFWMHSGILMT